MKLETVASLVGNKVKLAIPVAQAMQQEMPVQS